MRFQIAIGVFCVIGLSIANFSWSWELNQFRWVKSDNDEVLCGMSPPNKTIKAVGSRVECVSSCNRGCSSPCQSVNYWKNAQLCQLFYYVPCSYEVQHDCVNYQVTTTNSWSFELVEWNSTCSFLKLFNLFLNFSMHIMIMSFRAAHV